MPKIPRQAGRSVMPNVGGGGGGGGGAATNARSLASSAGAGLQSLGASVASSAAGLGQAFAHAGAVRDQINARAEAERKRIAERLDSMNQRTGAYSISMRGGDGIQEDERALTEQLRAQQDTDPRLWTLTVRSADGESDVTGKPEEIMGLMMERRVKQGLEEAATNYGPEAEMHVAEHLTRDASVARARFGDAALKLRHDKSLADWQGVANRLEDQAGDPSNRFREKAKLDLEDHIANGTKAGLFHPTQGVKIKDTMQDSIADKWATAEAMRDPVGFLKMISGPSAHAEAGEGDTGPIGIVKDPGQRLPEHLKAEKLPEYQKIALGELSRRQADMARVEKEYEKRTAAHQEKTFGDDMSEVLAGGSVAGKLPQQIADGDIDPDKANTLRIAEHQLKVQNANDPVLIKNSALARIDLSRAITDAMFGNGNLKSLTDEVWRKVSTGLMIPTDVEPLMTELRTARTHLVSEENQKQNERVQSEKAYIREILTAKGPLNQWDRIADDAKAEATNDFLHYMQMNPKQDPRKLRDEVLKVWSPVVEERKNILGTTPDKMKFDDAKLTSLVQQKALSPAGAKAIRERQENEKGRKIVSDFLSTYKPPPPTFWEKMKSVSERAKNFGSSLFDDDTTEAAP